MLTWMLRPDSPGFLGEAPQITAQPWGISLVPTGDDCIPWSRCKYLHYATISDSILAFTSKQHQYPNPCQQPREFPSGLPSKLCPGSMLNFRVWLGAGGSEIAGPLTLLRLILTWCDFHDDISWGCSSAVKHTHGNHEVEGSIPDDKLSCFLETPKGFPTTNTTELRASDQCHEHPELPTASHRHERGLAFNLARGSCSNEASST